MSEPSGFPGHVVARAASMADVDAITAVFAVGELHANGEVDVDRDDVAADLGRLGVDLARRSVVVEERGRVVAVGLVNTDRGRADGAVHPGHRGHGIGSSLVAWSERVAQSSGVASLRQVASDSDGSAIELLGRSGYEARWTGWLLEIRLGEEELSPLSPPGRIEVRPFEPGADDRVVHRLIQDAFGEWEGHVDQPFADWVAFSIGRETFDPLLSPVAVDRREIVGVALSLAYDEDEGYVHQLAVRRSHRRRGIGRALLLEAFRGFHQRGRRAVTLVTDSRTGALGMYERVGMRVRRSYTNFVKDL